LVTNGWSSLFGRRHCRGTCEHGLLRPFVQPLAAALHGREELLQVDLERRQDRVGPVLHLEPRLPRLPAGVVDDVLRLALGDLDDLRLRRLAHRLLAASPSSRSVSRFASASISWRSFTIHRPA
jgi:hypothetical protein